MRASTLAAVMRHIAEGSISRVDAADKLGVSERSVNRLMRKHGVERPPSPVHAARAAAAERRERRRGAAEKVMLKKLTVEAAADAAKCHPRTIYRWKNRVESEQKALKTKRKRIENSKK